MDSEMREHALRAISAAKVETEPWPHCYVPKLFPDPFYARLLNVLPSLDEMERLNSKLSTRYLYWLERNKGKHTIAPGALSPFWFAFREILFQDLRKALEVKLDVTGTSIGAELLHDLPGYQIMPHTDTPDKLITALFYLPSNDEGVKHGTVLYHNPTPDPTGKGHKLTADFRLVKTVPYLPNSGFFFRRTDVSYHGVLRSPIKRWLFAFDVFK